MKKKKYTNEEFINAVANSTSIRQVLMKLNLRPTGGNYKSFSNTVRTLNLDTSHFTGKLWSKGKSLIPKRNIEDYLSNQFSIQSHKLRKRLIKENIFTQKCYKCNLTTWNNQPISLELEHIDGNHQNNSLDNLTLLCPNCHAQTPTYRGKNKRKS